MKVVINTCYGGFGISLEALKELIKRNADCIESCTPKHYYGGDNEKYRGKDQWESKWNEDFKRFTDIGDGMKADGLTQYNIYKDGLLYSLKSRYEKENRTDKDLIEIVEQWGEKSFGSYAKLSVVEIPDGVSWEIDEYDGVETIHETHRTWG